MDGYELGKRNRMNSNDEATGRARKRVSRACDRCRVKKDKCDGLKPRCSPCIANNVECSYDPISKKRGLPEGYVRGLEKLWALSIIKIDGLEDVIRQIASQEQSLNLWSHDASGEVLHSKWKESGVLRELESMLSRTEADASTNHSKRKRDDESETFATPEDPVSAVYSLQPEYQVVSAGGQDFITGQTLASTSYTIDPSQASLPAAANMMLDHYFQYTHCWLPIVEKHHVMRTCYEHAKGQKRGSGADLAVLWAVLAYTSQQLDHESLEKTPKDMLSIAKELIPDDNGQFEVGHIQALLLISLLHLGLGQWNTSWILIGTASRVGLQLMSGTGRVIKRLGAILQACCILDTLVAGHLMLRPHLRRIDVQHLEYLEEDGSEDWEPWRTLSTAPTNSLEPAFIATSFNRLVDVVLIINDLMTNHTQNDADRSTYLADRRSALDALESRFPANGSRTDLMPHHLILRLFYLTALMSLAKQSANDKASSQAADETLSLLKQNEQSPAMAFRNVVPILEISLRAACYSAIASRHSFEETPKLPSYADFASKMTALAVKLSSSWAVFSSLASLLHTDTFTNGFSVQTTSSNSTFAMTASSRLSQNWSGQVSVGQGIATASDLWSITDIFQQDVIDPQLNHEASFGGMPMPSDSVAQQLQTPEQNETDMAMSGVNNPTPAGLAMPAPTEASPSFYGDEVDAIFHSFVGLDTTDWTDNRQKGLAEFGFADEDAFQAFCNDPERLLATNTNGQANINTSTDPWPPPGLYPELFHPPDVQMEASQILQSLSGQTRSTVKASDRGGWWS